MRALWCAACVLLVVACDDGVAPCRAEVVRTLNIKRFGPAYPGGLCVDSIQVWLDLCPDTTYTMAFDNCSQYAPITSSSRSP